jgi:hypothetical protein
MSYWMFGNVPVSVPPVKDTTPCMTEMLSYEDCVAEYPCVTRVPACSTRKWSTRIGRRSTRDCSPTAS